MVTEPGKIDATSWKIRMALALTCFFIFSLSFGGLVYSSYIVYNASHDTTYAMASK